MTGPLEISTILEEFDDDDELWVLKDMSSDQWVFIPHHDYPGRRPMHFSMKRGDAQSVLERILEVNEKLRDEKTAPVKLRLKWAMRRIASDGNPDHIDSFVVHTPNEVFEYVWNGC